MVVIDWLLTCQFVRENTERVVLYCLCGYLVGLSIILTAIIIILCIENRVKINNNYQSPRTDIEYDDSLSYMPVYRYNGRTHNDTTNFR